MTAELLLARLDRRGIKLVPAGSRLRFHPASMLSSRELEILALHKPDLLKLLSTDDQRTKRDPDGFPMSNDWNWSAISESDYAYLTGPRNYPGPCPWCGGRFCHNPLCDAMRASWEVVMPHGKHRGKKLSALPVDYLLWLSRRLQELPGGLAEAVATELQRRTTSN